MSPRLAVVLGLLLGILLVVGAAIAIVLLTPPTTRRIPASFAPLPSASAPSPAASASVAATSGSAGPSPAGSSPSGASTAFHVGQLAPALRLPEAGDGTVDLAQLRGKAVWVYFMATWCPSCREEIPLMNGFAAKYGDKGLVVLAVDVRESEATVISFATGLNTAFPVALDADGTAAQAWSVVGLPVHFWVDRQGIVRDGALGGIGADVMAAGVRAILPGVDVTP